VRCRVSPVDEAKRPEVMLEANRGTTEVGLRVWGEVKEAEGGKEKEEGKEEEDAKESDAMISFLPGPGK